MRLAKLFSVSFIILALSANIAFAIDSGNTRKGKFLYRKNCRSCHGVTASDLSPLSKDQADWKSIYAEREKIACVGDWPSMSDADLKDTFSYLFTFAKDSPTPAKCE